MTTCGGIFATFFSSVDAAARVGEQRERLVVLDVDAGPLQHLERGVVDGVEVCLGERADADSIGHEPAGVLVSFHATSLSDELRLVEGVRGALASVLRHPGIRAYGA